jgi:hypothetical protein
MIKCPECGSVNTITVESREPENCAGWRRRKRCHDCEVRFSTRELIYKENRGRGHAPLVGGFFLVTPGSELKRIDVPNIRTLHAQLLAVAEILETALFEIDGHEP